jgi:cyclase
VEDINEMLQSGADKVSINTAAHRDIKIIGDASEAFGAQSVVASVQAKRRARMQWDSLYLNGRENSSKSVVDWCKALVDGGVGEILLTSIDHDGTMMGPDKELIDTVLANVRIPVVVSGGVSSVEDVLWIAEAGASGVAIARCLHFKHFGIKDVKKYLQENNIAVSWRY